MANRTEGCGNSDISPLFWETVRYVQGKLTLEEVRRLDRQLIENEDAWALFVKVYKLQEKGLLEGYLEATWKGISDKSEKPSFFQ